MENFISVLFFNREDEGAFDIKDDELNTWQIKLESTRKELHNLMSEKLDEKYQPRFNHLFLDLEEIQRNIFDILKLNYYKVGIKDGANISNIIKED